MVFQSNKSTGKAAFSPYSAQMYIFVISEGVGALVTEAMTTSASHNGRVRNSFTIEKIVEEGKRLKLRR
jgi:hypothetical protein